jgi:hypothetical protein
MANRSDSNPPVPTGYPTTSIPVAAAPTAGPAMVFAAAAGVAAVMFA